MSISPCIANSSNIPAPVICPAPIPPICQKVCDLTVPNQISYLNEMIRNFIYLCDSVLGELQSARHMELLDMNTSNSSLVGYFISNMSHTKNHDVARRVDHLQREAEKINQAVQLSGLPIGHYLNVYVNGNDIRTAENAEHSYFYDWFTSGAYSSMGSANTAAQIQTTISRVEQLRWQACSLQSSLFPRRPLNGEFFP